MLFVGSVPPTRFGGSHVGDVVYGFRVKRCGAVMCIKMAGGACKNLRKRRKRAGAEKYVFRMARARKSWSGFSRINPKSVEGSSSLTFVFSLRKIKQSESESRDFQLEVSTAGRARARAAPKSRASRIIMT